MYQDAIALECLIAALKLQATRARQPPDSRTNHAAATKLAKRASAWRLVGG